MSDEVFEQKCTCSNCWTSVTVKVEKSSDTGRPEGWGIVRVLAEGILNGDRLMCKECLSWMTHGLTTSRGLAQEAREESNPVLMTQLGTGKQAYITADEYRTWMNLKQGE
jgi:hypothetical protein